MNMHQYVLEVVDAMTPKEKGQWSDLMKNVGGEVFLETPVDRPIVIQKAKQPYQFVLGPKKQQAFRRTGRINDESSLTIR